MLEDATTDGPSLATALGNHRYALLTTYRRNGQAVSTSIWFAAADGKVYFRTSAEAGKAKRLTHNPRAQIAPSTAMGRRLGPVVDVVARRLGPEESAIARRAIGQRYGVMVPLVDLIVRVRHHDRIFFHIQSP